jgi:hypothetical protein
MKGGKNMTTNGNGAGYWLWVDPRREGGYTPATFDQAAFLARAVVLFRTKERWGGQPPNTVRANPDQAANGLQAAAQVLSLRVVSDPLVTAGTYRLGVVNWKGGDRELV